MLMIRQGEPPDPQGEKFASAIHDLSRSLRKTTQGRKEQDACLVSLMVYYLDLICIFDAMTVWFRTYYPKWYFDCDLPWYREKNITLNKSKKMSSFWISAIIGANGHLLEEVSGWSTN